jgi:DNA (cytosine-5)-methyltransferase 1
MKSGENIKLNYHMKKLIIGDMFCGAGGTSHGLVNSDFAEIAWAINHDPKCIEAHKKNHPGTLHFEEDIVSMKIEKLSRVDLLWASLECTHFSGAKGGQSRDADSRMLARQMYRYIRQTDPSIIVIENVKEFLSWGPLIDKEKNGKMMQMPDPDKKGVHYKEWVATITAMGYDYEYSLLNAADHGARTSRSRFFGVFVKKELTISFPQPSHAKEGKNGLPAWLPCRDLIDLKNEGNSIFGRKFNETLPKNVRKPLVDNTLKRIVSGVKKFCIEGDLIYDPHFIAKYYGSGDNNSSLKGPLHTITTKDRHLLVSLEKEHFVAEHFGTNRTVNQPMPTIMAYKDQKYIVTTDYFSTAQYSSGGNPGANVHSLDKPLGTILTNNKHNVVAFKKAEFITQQYGRTNANVDLDSSFPTVTTLNQNQLVTMEKMEFISRHFSGELVNKKFNYLIDIKTRFLTADELKMIQGFDADYELIGSQATQKKAIGNSVVPILAQRIIEELWMTNHQLLYKAA